ncbi:MAG: hypothetical protein PHO30_03000 [Candidatus Omnitrophica bacterium]|nr:hypothetical protein [Candidatus Omnitrophota bacterium]
MEIKKIIAREGLIIIACVFILCMSNLILEGIIPLPENYEWINKKSTGYYLDGLYIETEKPTNCLNIYENAEFNVTHPKITLIITTIAQVMFKMALLFYPIYWAIRFGLLAIKIIFRNGVTKTHLREILIIVFCLICLIISVLVSFFKKSNVGAWTLFLYPIYLISRFIFWAIKILTKKEEPLQDSTGRSSKYQKAHNDSH